MSAACTILLVEDEPLILMDLEFAVEDHGCDAVCTTCCGEAMTALEHGTPIHTAVLDVSLKGGETCEAIAHELDRRGIPYLLHSGDLDRHNETVRRLGAQLLPKPASAHRVISAAIKLAEARVAIAGTPWRRPGPTGSTPDAL
ncbi:MAG: response regulator [Croceibacterium sp.]